MASPDRKAAGTGGTPTGKTAPATIPRGATLTLAIISAAVFLTALDQTVVVTALTPIATSANLTLPNDLAPLSWVVSGYLLGYVIVMPLMGRVSDIWGRRRVLLGCLGLFAFSSLLCALALRLGALVDLGFLSHIGINSPSSQISWLVAARFLQAVGGGAVVPVAIAAAGDLFGEKRRILALGIIGGVTEAGGALGPLYGALILAKWPFLPAPFADAWQWIFLLNIPLVVLIAVGIWRLWPRSARQVASAQPGGRIDWLGALILGGALVGISLGFGQEAGAAGNLATAHVAQNNPILLVTAVVLLALFVFVEARQRDPVVALDLFRSGAFSAGAVYSLLLGIALIVALVDIPIYMLTVFGGTAYFEAGFALLRMTVMIPIGAFTGGWLVTRFGTRPIAVLGAMFTAVGFFLLHRWTGNVGWTEITIGTVITGTGFGLIVAPISTTALNTTSNARFGMAAAIVTALRMIGMILGLAVLSSWGVSRYAELAKQVPHIKDVTNATQVAAFQQGLLNAATHTITDLFLLGAIVAALAIIPACFLWKPQPGDTTAGEVAVFSMGL